MKARFNIVMALKLHSVEKYNNRDSNRISVEYLSGNHGKIVDSLRGKPPVWSGNVIYAAGFSICHAVIAISPNRIGQMVHYSRDPWFLTDYDQYSAVLQEWHSEGCDVVLMHALRTSASRDDYAQLRIIFGGRYSLVNFGVDSRFEICVDVKQRTILVDLTDMKEIRRYTV